jgi:hypothetical protein
LAVSYFSHARERRKLKLQELALHSLPTDLLPTMAIFLCFGGAGGILLVVLEGFRADEERYASVEVLAV